jgi:hypothetical protein
MGLMLAVAPAALRGALPPTRLGGWATGPREISMPPLSYAIIAIVLAALVAVSFPLTLGFSIILWYWLFAAAACVLAVVGAFKITHGLCVPLWIGIGLASPALMWAVSHLREMMSNMRSPAMSITFGVAAGLAYLAAGASALRLVETISRPHAAFRVGYWVLAAAALLTVIGFLAYTTMGWILAKSALYATSARAVAVAASLVKYGAVAAAALLITARRDIERWTGAVISLISAYMLYKALWPSYPVVGQAEGLAFWLQPVLMFVGGAAVWRMGSLLRAQANSGLTAQSQHVANAAAEPST